MDSVLSEYDRVQDVLDREERISELDEEIKMRQLTLQKLDKPLHPAKPSQFSSVPDPAACHESSPITFVNDPTHVPKEGDKGHFPLGGKFRAEQHFLLFKDQLAESRSQKTKENIIPRGKFLLVENDPKSNIFQVLRP